jgi:hypothetical protein
VHEFGRELQHEWPVDGHTHSLATKFVALAAAYAERENLLALEGGAS